ncbi:MAG: pilus assembly protein PilP [Acidobacteriota bacterium]
MTRRDWRHSLAAVGLAAAVAATGLAQAPTGTPSANAQPAGPTAPPDAGPPMPPPNYAYVAEGRRDPFVSLVGRGTAEGARRPGGGPRVEGVAGLLINDVAVRGILRSGGSFLAMVTGPDGRTYTIRRGDRMADGLVRDVTADAVVFMQEVSDPLSLAKQREVRKYLRGGGEGVK